MSEVQISTSVVPKAAADEPLPAPSSTTTITHYQQIAAQLLAEVQKFVAQIPGYTAELPIAKTRRVVTPEFMGMSLDAIADSIELQGVQQMDTEDTRDTLQFREAIRSLISNLTAVTKRLEKLLATREAKAGRAALAIYNIARRIARNPNNTHVAVHVEKMRAELRKTRGVRPTKAALARAAARAAAANDGGEVR